LTLYVLSNHLFIKANCAYAIAASLTASAHIVPGVILTVRLFAWWDGQWSLLAELVELPDRLVDAREMAGHVESTFRSEGFIPPDAEVVSQFHHVANPGYPTPTLGRGPALELLLPRLEALDVLSRGRFGTWRYEIANQDHVFLQGAELVGRLLKGEEEKTFLSARH